MSNSNVNLNRLLREGLIEQPVHPELQALIESLRQEEVDALIAVKQKLGIPQKIPHDEPMPMCGF